MYLASRPVHRLATKIVPRAPNQEGSMKKGGRRLVLFVVLVQVSWLLKNANKWYAFLLPDNVASRVSSDRSSVDSTISNKSMSNNEKQNDATMNDPSWPFSYNATNNQSQAKLYFVHVGKAGGSTLYQNVRLNAARPWLACRMNHTRTSINTANTNTYTNDGCYHPPPSHHSQLYQHTYGHYHLWNPLYSDEERQWLLNNTNVLLFTVRHPLDRFISAFGYHHAEMFDKQTPKNQNTTQPPPVKPRFVKRAAMYNGCFATVQDMAETLLSLQNHKETNINNDDNHHQCATIARQLLQGKDTGNYGSHYWCNFQYYWKYTQNTLADNKKNTAHVAVVRTEALWSDVNGLEVLLGGSNSTFAHHLQRNVRQSHGSEAFAVSRRDVSPEARAVLCCHLIAELQVYQHLIQSSINLPADEKRWSLQQLHVRCGVDPSEIRALLADDSTVTNDYQVVDWNVWNTTVCQGRAV